MVCSILFLFVAPGVVAGLVPWWLTRWAMGPPLPGSMLLQAIGAVLILFGALIVLESFARFALHGLGTPAPIYPTRRLVVSGFYRHVRNPIYVGVVSIVLGEGLVLRDLRLLAYGAVVWLAMHLFVLAYEEPTLRRSFGAEYDLYASQVRRWIPRGRGWSRDGG